MKQIVIILVLAVLGSTADLAGCPDSDQKIDSLPFFKKGEDFPCQYSGFINIKEGQGLFYWYFRNEDAPADFPVLLWLNGGPGASSMTGLFEENGPLELSQPEDEIILSVRENSWLEYSHLVYVDQPVGTGFSFTDGEYVGTEEGVAEDFLLFLNQFVKTFPETKEVDWSFFGESYAGKYTPWISKYILEAKTPPIQLKKIGLIDPLVFAMLQKTTTRNEVYGGLGIMDPSEINQYTTMQENCAIGLYSNSKDQTSRCGTTEDFMTSVTSNIQLTDVRNFTDIYESNLIYVYFNQQSQSVQNEIKANMHIEETPKGFNIFGSDPQVYQAFAKTNDIYGEESLTIIEDLITVKKIPFIIMEGVMDTLDGILGLEIYKNWLVNQCKPRQLIKYKDSEGICQPYGFLQDCSSDKNYEFYTTGVWSAGHLIPTNQLLASDFIVDNFLNNGNYCEDGCDCTLKTMQDQICKEQLNECNKQGDCDTEGEKVVCKCNKGYYGNDCSVQIQSIDLSKNMDQQIDISSSWNFVQITNLEKYYNSNKSVNFLQFDFGSSLNVYVYIDGTQTEILSGQDYYQAYYDVKSIYLSIIELDKKSADIVLALQNTKANTLDQQLKNLKNQQNGIKTADNMKLEVKGRKESLGPKQTFFLAKGFGGFAISLAIFITGICLCICAFYYDKKKIMEKKGIEEIPQKAESQENTQLDDEDNDSDKKRRLLPDDNDD